MRKGGRTCLSGGEGDPFRHSLMPSRTKSRVSSNSEPTPADQFTRTVQEDQDPSVLRVGSALEPTLPPWWPCPLQTVTKRQTLHLLQSSQKVCGWDGQPLSVSQAACKRDILTIKIFLSLEHSSTVSNQFGGRGVWGGNTKGHQGSHSRLCSVSRLRNLGKVVC